MTDKSKEAIICDYCGATFSIEIEPEYWYRCEVEGVKND